jgi:hypothetical protein
MKKARKIILTILVVLILAAAAWIMLGRGSGFGIGSGSGFGKKSANNLTAVSAVESVESDIAETNKAESDEQEDKDIPDDRDLNIIEVSVVENEYFYENRRTEIDELLESLNKIDMDIVVKITDDSATLKAYNKLLEKLEEALIPYMECEQ